MSFILKSFIKIQGFYLQLLFERWTKNPQKAQKNFLLKLIRKNKKSEYGKSHHFDRIGNVADYRMRVPINRYEDLEPLIQGIAQGRKSVLTRDEVLLFNLTSGTSNKPKFIPVTKTSIKKTSALSRLWLFNALKQETELFNASCFLITSSAIEGYTQGGIGYGSLSGLIYQHLPKVIGKSYVLPYAVSDIKNYDLRYYIMARLALERDVSFLATPNPTTLMKIAEVGIEYQDEIIRSISQGVLFHQGLFTLDEKDMKLVGKLEAALKPNPGRASYLAQVISRYGKLIPVHCWPSLKLIGCWLGGSIGIHAEKLTSFYGNTTKFELGFMASEGCFSLPVESETSAGILALNNNFYEFIPEESVFEVNPPVLLAHELEVGRFYKILITNENGLYRYDMNDTIQVEKFYHKTPVISFVRKTADVLNITGEKLHINQFMEALQTIQVKYDLPFKQFRVAANHELLRYEIFIHFNRDVPAEFLKDTILPAIDRYLCDSNIEYQCKRGSKRLNPPCMHIMSSVWEDEIRKSQVGEGKRDIQFKWKPLADGLQECDIPYIQSSII